MKNYTRLKRAIACLAFVAIVFVLFTELTWLFRSNNKWTKDNMLGFRHLDSVDVVLVGGSNINLGFQPLEAWNEAGFTSYNYATFKARTDQFVSFLEESRTSHKASLYVCDIRGLTLVDDEITDATIRNWSDSLPIFSPARIKGITSYLFDKEDWREENIVSYYLDIAKYHSNYEVLGKARQWLSLNRRQLQVRDKGNCMAVSFARNHIPFDRPQATSASAPLSEDYAAIMGELLDYCDSERLPVLFIVSPYIIPERDWEVFNACGDLIRERGYEFVNFNEYYDEIGLDTKTDFGDLYHINCLGARKYTKFLTDYLSKHYDLPDHRGDAAFASWDRDYAEFVEYREGFEAEVRARVERDLMTLDVDERLPQTDDLATWLELIQDANYTLLVEKDQSVDNAVAGVVPKALYARMLSQWQIDPAQEDYVGAWKNGESLLVDDETGAINKEVFDGETFTGEIGVDAYRGCVPCRVSAGDAPQIVIGETDYYSGKGGIQVVVFDNNLQKVVDSVNIVADDAGVRLVR